VIEIICWLVVGGCVGLIIGMELLRGMEND